MTNEQGTLCAWCLAEQNEAANPNDSHGVCLPHAEQIMIDYHTRKFEEVPSYVEMNAKNFAREY